MRLLSHCLSAVALGVTPAAAVEFGDADLGAGVFVECSGCHQLGPEAENGIGPHLNGIFGRRAAGVDDYRYSESLARAGNDGLIWDLETLDFYVQNPKGFASGTKMNYPGLEDARDRADLLAFLRAYSDNPADIPEAAPTFTALSHDLDPAILAIQGDPEYGEYLSNECLTCHRADGTTDGIPSITLWPVQDFVIAMHAYKRKMRPHPVMQMMAGRLNDEEIAALAAYFATLE